MRNPRDFVTFVLAAVMVSAILSGCGGSTATGTVSGKVTFQGKAIPKGSTVVFTPDAGGASAFGEIAADGSYSLTHKDGSGIPTGKYQIAITPPADEMSTEDAMKQSMNMKTPPKKSAKDDFPEIPEKYRAPESSDETFEVEQGENTYNLDMKPGK